jgi:hypothetical protein
MASGTSVS